MKVAPVARRRRAIFNMEVYPPFKWANLNITIFMEELRKSTWQQSKRSGAHIEKFAASLSQRSVLMALADYRANVPCLNWEVVRSSAVCRASQNCIYFQRGNERGCYGYTYLGRQIGRGTADLPWHPITIGECSNTRGGRRVAIHELGHALGPKPQGKFGFEANGFVNPWGFLGLPHTHNRWDRDQFVRVLFENIEVSGYDQFTKVNPQHYTDYDGVYPYDLNSVMHYTETAVHIYSLTYPSFVSAITSRSSPKTGGELSKRWIRLSNRESTTTPYSLTATPLFYTAPTATGGTCLRRGKALGLGETVKEYTNNRVWGFELRCEATGETTIVGCLANLDAAYGVLASWKIGCTQHFYSAKKNFTLWLRCEQSQGGTEVKFSGMAYSRRLSRDELEKRANVTLCPL